MENSPISFMITKTTAMKTFTFLSLCSASCFAQLPPNQTGKMLDKNYVRAAIHTVNDKFWEPYTSMNHSYEVPAGSNRHAAYGNSIWIAGIDNSGQLRVAANFYKQNGTDFFPGPLDTTNANAFNATNSTPYNRLWKVDCNDISAFVNAFNAGSVANGSYQIPNDILNYPAKGTNNFQRNLCPFVDVNNNGLYNPQTEGDYPVIRGNQQVLSIFNDANGIHTESQSSAPMGVEIQERSYCYYDPTIADSMQVLNYTTFYHYTIINRSNNHYNNVYITDWSDIDVGNFANDFIGTDSLNQFAYCYNGTASDPDGNGMFGYGNKPPVLSHTLIKTNCSSDGIDNNNNGVIDEPGEQFKMNRTSYFNGNLPQTPVQTTNPGTTIQYYNYMSGFWKDGSPFTYGGNAYGGTTPNPYVYTGNPSTNTGWTESTANHNPGDRRILFSSGPFNFPAGAKIEWGFAIVFSRDTTVIGNTISQFDTRVRRDVKNMRYYDETHGSLLCGSSISTGIRSTSLKEQDVLVYPNPSGGNVFIDLPENAETLRLTLSDLTGHVVMQAAATNTYRIQLEVSSLESGLYLAEIITDKGSVTKKIAKF